MLQSLLQLRVMLPALIGGLLFYTGVSSKTEVFYDAQSATTTPVRTASTTPVAAVPTLPPPFVVTHIKTPIPVKAAYMTSCIASGKSLRAPLTRLVEQTELNALVIDIKDFSGMVSVDFGDPRFVVNSKGCTIPDVKEYIAELHKKNIYVIGRVTVMQDSVYTKSHPDAAVKRRSDGGIWKDKKGLAFVDPGASEYWQYMVDIGKASYALGFDEINYDYVRYPSDGDMSNAKFTRTGSTTKAVMMDRFFSYLGKAMRVAGVPSSVDLFGMTTTNTDDLGIGQVLESALRNFDYVAPMVYPSHYPPNFNGWKNPNLVPYEIIQFVMSRAVTRANALEQKESGWVAPVVGSTTPIASTTPTKFVPQGIYANRLRPWIQDFDYGKVYTEADVRAQKRATYDAGLTSWMSWDPSNKYTPSAYNTAELATIESDGGAVLP
ncbi:MAG: hypothetical protein A2845_03255 [Candidatus Lloydbacteria bacterium RIFCSPHIGHO2_01_FULL_49_22]|uniref:DUF4015 domain-containing protein n=1 Tax=Candidatus Lloydbacteria bacterium RIFCSPHIGHO2_01_FULL_49_22 TaxID=1798658 RepID=A0A1G2CWP1_9BACT|nr:MAG: hypothetical protein A2845_03255 [Candidatus Lloydbacteria bacterium RIFCSPHIGHO2_01_FULL_49_22]